MVNIIALVAVAVAVFCFGVVAGLLWAAAVVGPIISKGVRHV